MATVTKKKKDWKQDINAFINFIADKGQHGAVRDHTTPEAINEYEQIAREQRMKQVPKRDNELPSFVFAKTDAVSSNMTHEGKEGAVNLATLLEESVQNKTKLNLKKWMEGA